MIKWTGGILAGIISWIMSAIFLSHVAYDYVSFLAASVTGSCAFKLPVSCGYFEWDKNLQIASYLSYLFAFILILLGVYLTLKKAKNKAYKWFAILVFIASFPTYTNWGVASICGGFGPCSTGYTIDVVAPLVVTFGIWTIPTAILSIGIAWVYVVKNKVKI